mmetsp:Transcript_8133/g.36214  ORF Transcript_8133/g.36214 Transcript_8133/m.36214 type:complete len:267 (-) Transcript_8133:996-1796(-)
MSWLSLLFNHRAASAIVPKVFMMSITFCIHCFPTSKAQLLKSLVSGSVAFSTIQTDVVIATKTSACKICSSLVLHGRLIHFEASTSTSNAGLNTISVESKGSSRAGKAPSFAFEAVEGVGPRAFPVFEAFLLDAVIPAEAGSVFTPGPSPLFAGFSGSSFLAGAVFPGRFEDVSFSSTLFCAPRVRSSCDAGFLAVGARTIGSLLTVAGRWAGSARFGALVEMGCGSGAWGRAAAPFETVGCPAIFSGAVMKGAWFWSATRGTCMG